MPISKRKPKDDEASVTSETKQPLKSVPALMGEGEKFFRDQLYSKAVQCYSEALELSPGNKNALVERAACYLKLDRNDLALQDAEESLKENKEFTKGLYQKAEALYAMGEFELALVFFHRGKKLRSDVREFQLGINKAQEAIDNSVGDPRTVKLEVKGDLAYFEKPDEKQKQKQKQAGYQKPMAQKQIAQIKREKRVQKAGSQKTVKQLLGELYADKVYLEKLLEDDKTVKVNTKSGDAIYTLANNGLDFLDYRTEFWRQQKPIYARKSSLKPMNSKDPLTYILHQLEGIDNLQNNGNYAESLKKCEVLMKYVNRLKDEELKDKERIISNIYSNMGNAYLELGKYDLALESHEKDLAISTKNNVEEDKSRALENLGRVYARNGKFQEAIDVWEKKVPLVNSEMEKAWLYHEIGRCYLELGNNEKAKSYGKDSLVAADNINDNVWKLNATVLIAQSEAKMGDVESLMSAIKNFKTALEMTKAQNDKAAENAITKALSECEQKLQKLRASEAAEYSNYIVQVKTSEEKGSGTDANVTISMFGTRGDITNASLKNSNTNINAFEAGKLDEFILSKQNNIGKINKISIGRDASGVGASWKVDYVKIIKDDIAEYYFTINKWIETKLDLEPDPESAEKPDKKSSSVMDNKNDNKTTGKTSKTPSKTPTSKSPTEEKTIEYTIKVATGTKIASGTDSKAFLVIYGDKGETDKLNLINPGKDVFEMGAKDEFKIVAANVGDVKKVNLSHDGTKIGDGWFVDEVVVIAKGKTYTFPVDRWLDIHEHDKKTSVDLYPNTKPGYDDGDKVFKVPPKSDEKIIDYYLKIATAEKIGAGTDANVFIQIYGDKGQTEKIQLKKDKKNVFEKGNTDEFKISGTNVGDVKKINLSHDGAKTGAGWYVDSVLLAANGNTYSFPVDRWLDTSEGDKKIAIDLEPNKKPGYETPTDNDTFKVPPKSDDKIIDYYFKVTTGNKLGAGTDSSVFVIIYGDQGQTEKIQLKRTDKDAFEKDATDEIKITAPNVGEVKKINLSHNGTQVGDGWYVDQIVLAANGKTYTFPIDRWLDVNEGDKKITVDLEPNKKPGYDNEKDEFKVPPKTDDKIIDYFIKVQTGNKLGAGTDSNVFLIIYGDKGQTEKLQLKNPNKDVFEKGKADEFKINAANVGDIKKINLSHDGKQVGDGWFVDNLTIAASGNTYKFPVERWLDAHEGDGKTALDLEPNKKP